MVRVRFVCRATRQGLCGAEPSPLSLATLLSKLSLSTSGLVSSEIRFTFLKSRMEVLTSCLSTNMLFIVLSYSFSHRSSVLRSLLSSFAFLRLASSHRLENASLACIVKGQLFQASMSQRLALKRLAYT